MNYENASPVLAWMAVSLKSPTVFNEAIRKAAQRVNKKLPKPRRNRLK